MPRSLEAAERRKGLMHEGKQIRIMGRGQRPRVVEGTSYGYLYDLILCTIVY
jgi:hypothetical protein